MISKAQLKKWDHKDTQALYKMYENLPETEDLTRVLGEIVQSEPLTLPTISWLMKHHLEKRQNSRIEKEPIINLFPMAKDWSTRLHLLQILPYLPLGTDDIEPLLPIIEDWLENEPNKFVKAWAYNALAIFTRLIPDLLPETEERFSLALEEESPAVRARIRKAIKEQSLPISFN